VSTEQLAPLEPTLSPYDAHLLYSFGGPNKPEDVVPFLRNVTAGKGIPDSRLEEVGEHYYGFGGKSPINEQNLALKAALETELDRRGIITPIVWGNRNWEPYTTDALDQLAELGAKRAVMLVTSAYGSYSGCRQYREDMALVQRERGDIDADGNLTPQGIEFDKVRPYFNHPGFVDATYHAVAEALLELEGSSTSEQPRTHLAFVTHSVPDAMEQGSALHHPASYSEQHLALAEELISRIAAQTGRELDWSLSYCSRSGPPHQPWLEPDINDHLEELADQGVTDVVIAPIGFISDHMEVAYDLDTEALATCEKLELNAVRADTVGTRPQFVAGLVDLLLERAVIARGEQVEPAAATRIPALHDTCPANCCLQRAGQSTGIPTVAGQ
jgi:ferrochelatase